MGNVKKFISELKGKTVMTNDGQILGVIENFIMETSTGDLEHVLVIPAEEVDARMYKTDPQGRLILPFSEMKAVKDVVIMSVE
jgi:sporulation protein YlmC with PRC-barrel domain